MKAKDLIKVLNKTGFKETRVAKHRIFSNSEGQHVAVPHKRELNKMLCMGILKEINCPIDVPQINYYASKMAA